MLLTSHPPYHFRRDSQYGRTWIAGWGPAPCASVPARGIGCMMRAKFFTATGLRWDATPRQYYLISNFFLARCAALTSLVSGDQEPPIPQQPNQTDVLLFVPSEESSQRPESAVSAFFVFFFLRNEQSLINSPLG